jgi:hypothetical protein
LGILDEVRSWKEYINLVQNWFQEWCVYGKPRR